MTLAQILETCALEEDFALASVLDLDLAAASMAPHVARYDQWLGRGNAAAMQYLERGRDRRADPRLVFAESQSILCVALPYPKRPGGASDGNQGPRYARYISGRDYHQEIAERLERSMRNAAIRSGLGSELRWKVCVDSSAVLERSWAALAGIGWIGKNTLLIHPKLGSYFFLGEVLINQVTGQGPRPLPDFCGNCTRCLQGCPTQALTEPHWLDARRCISYWTLEKRGALELSEIDLRKAGPWIAGCDICQEVCPFNIKPVKNELGSGKLVPEIPTTGAAPCPSPMTDQSSVETSLSSAETLNQWLDLLRETPEQYRARVKESALSRIKPAQFSRNLAITLGNAVLENPAALEPLRPWVQLRLTSETDLDARMQWERCNECFNSD